MVVAQQQRKEREHREVKRVFSHTDSEIREHPSAGRVLVQGLQLECTFAIKRLSHILTLRPCAIHLCRPKAYELMNL